MGVQAGDCLYVGDGGSDELEAAETVGMRGERPVAVVGYRD